MATGTEAFDNSLGGTSGVVAKIGAQFAKPVYVFTRLMDAAEIIADDATLTAAAKITAGQEITALTLPVGFLACGTVTYIKTAGTSGGTLNIGTYADTTAFDAAISNATADAWFQTETDAQGIASGGFLVTSTTSDANKVCVEYIADETTGSVVVAVWGFDFSDIVNAV